MLERYRKTAAPTRALWKGITMILGTAYAAALTDQVFDLRNSCLPEPFDYPQHAGNVAAGAVIGSVIGTVSAKMGSRGEQSHGHVRAVATAGAAVVGLAVNAVFETRTGIKLFRLESFAGTPDLLDLAYGVGSSAVSGAIAPTFANEPPGET